MMELLVMLSVLILNVTYRVENGNEASITWYNWEQDQHAVCIHMKVEWESDQ